MQVSILLFMILVGYALSLQADSTAPVFENNILTLPRVDYAGKIAHFQNLQFKLAADGRWDLQKYADANPALVAAVELLSLPTVPVQVQVKISGYLPSKCYRLGEIFSQRDGNQFTLAVNQIQLQTLVACAAVIEPFTTKVALDVYGLPKGRYTVNVNNVTQYFELPKDNQ